MKHIFYTALLTASIQWAMAVPPIAVSAETSTKVKSLLSELPPQAMLWQYQSLVNNPHKDADKNETRVAVARQQVTKAHEIIPQVRKLLKMGASVFSYPGLLAHGDITYQAIGKADPFAANANIEMGYRLYMGLPVGQTRHTFDLEILFDSVGTIREIAEVHGKE
jgi:hypothetical protein